MKKWEYRVIQLSHEIRKYQGPEKLDALLNQLGDEGREVFDVNHSVFYGLLSKFMIFGQSFAIAKREKLGLKKVPDPNGTAGEFAEISAAANLAGMAALVFVMRAGEKSNRGVAGLHGSLSFSLAGPFLGGGVR